MAFPSLQTLKKTAPPAVQPALHCTRVCVKVSVVGTHRVRPCPGLRWRRTWVVCRCSVVEFVVMLMSWSAGVVGWSDVLCVWCACMPRASSRASRPSSKSLGLPALPPPICSSGLNLISIPFRLHPLSALCARSLLKS